MPAGAKLEAFTAVPGVKAPVAEIPPPIRLGYEGAAPNSVCVGVDGNTDPPPIRGVDGRVAPKEGIPVGRAPELNMPPVAGADAAEKENEGVDAAG